MRAIKAAALTDGEKGFEAVSCLVPEESQIREFEKLTIGKSKKTSLRKLEDEQTERLLQADESRAHNERMLSRLMAMWARSVNREGNRSGCSAKEGRARGKPREIPKYY